jgi:hypothetical protein
VAEKQQKRGKAVPRTGAIRRIFEYAKYKLINTWVVRGLALDRVENCSDTRLPLYSRIGYFELDSKHNGFLHADFSFDRKFSSAERKGLENNFLRKWPSVDPYGFFKDAPEQKFIII